VRKHLELSTHLQLKRITM